MTMPKDFAIGHHHAVQTKPYSNGMTDSKFISVCRVCDCAGNPAETSHLAKSSFIIRQGKTKCKDNKQ